MIGRDGLLRLVALLRIWQTAQHPPAESACIPCPTDRSTWLPPPRVAPSVRPIPLCHQLPAPARQQGLALRSQMVERQLGPVAALGKEGRHEEPRLTPNLKLPQFGRQVLVRRRPVFG
jgi:hypothetical protein